MKKLKTILLDVYNESVSIIEIEPTLEEYYKHLNCDCIDIVTRKIGRKHFNIMGDDESLFHDPQKISAIDNLGNPMLFGNLMFFHSDEDGNLVSLSNSDIEYIKKRIVKMYTRQYPDGYDMLTQCEYY